MSCYRGPWKPSSWDFNLQVAEVISRFDLKWEYVQMTASEWWSAGKEIGNFLGDYGNPEDIMRDQSRWRAMKTRGNFLDQLQKWY